MDLMATLMSIGIISGFGLLLYGVFFQKSDASKNGEDGSLSDLERMKATVEEADNTLSDLNSVSSMIIEEIDIKYKELLFLYQVLEDKKKELLTHTGTSNFNSGQALHEEPFPNQENQNYQNNYNNYNNGYSLETLSQTTRINSEIMETNNRISELKNSPKLRDSANILELHSKGYNETEIAKHLGIGKGEVKFIIGLSRAGAGCD